MAVGCLLLAAGHYPLAAYYTSGDCDREVILRVDCSLDAEYRVPLLAGGYRLLAAGCWLPDTARWLLASGKWPVAASCWLLAFDS